jgi:protein TonB
MKTAAQRHALIWTVVVAAVLVLHGAALWALQLRLTAEGVPVLVPPAIEMVVRQVDSVPQIAAVLPVPRPAAHAPVRPVKARAKPESKAEPTTTAVLPLQRSAPFHQSAQPAQLVAESAPAVSAPITLPASAEAAQIGGAPPRPASAVAGTDLPTQAPDKAVLPSADAAYLRNQPPDYPPMSRWRHESGTVVVRVLIGVDGRAQAAQVEQSSGYGRLDDAALTTARDRWRYRPGTRGGVPEAMWYDVPIRFVLE